MKFSIKHFFSKCDQIRRYKAINKGSGVEKKRFLRYVIIKWSYGQDEKVRGAKSATTCKTGILAA